MQNKRWKLRPAIEPQEQIVERSRKYGIPPLVASILSKRGISNLDEYIIPELNKLYDPFLMKDMEQAVKRIVSAIQNKETVYVYGDYDVDGITSTAILTHFLRSQGVPALYYIPDRLQEGYGVNCNAVEEIAAKGATLLITVDCGISSVKEVEKAKAIGLDVIITDHHECKEELPDAVAVLNPKRPDCNYPFKQLAGVGVVFKLLQALFMELKIHMQTLFDAYLDITAIGTVADVMPLMSENRMILKNGLERLTYTENKGLRALIQQAGVGANPITAGTIGFVLAPRINAAGRVGDPKCAVELLLSEVDKTAEEYALFLDESNRSRQNAEQDIFKEALAMLESDSRLKEESVLVLAHEGWHHGIIGIVASKITERFHKPCILISLDETTGKGSGRSIKNFNLFAALTECQAHLIKFGGHELAAGLTVAREQIELFRQKINAYAKEVLQPEDYIPEIVIDAELPISYLNLNTIDKISVMAPYGMGNASPVFVCRNLRVTGMRLLSGGKHIKLTLSDGRCTVNAIGFSMGELGKTISIRDMVDIVFTLDSNVYHGERQAQILLKDVRLASAT